VVLDELHVLQRRPCAVCQGHAVTGVDVGVRGEREDLAAAAGCQDHCLGDDRLGLPGGQLDGDHAVHATVIGQ
jgi:hypothetical protein